MADTANRDPTVLVVEDDPNIRRMITTSLTIAGYQSREAPNGRQALEIMRDGGADVVVLDLMLPEVNGWEVLSERAKDPLLRDIAVIVISASREPAIADAVTKGICAFLPKPFELQALLALVGSCVRAGAHAPNLSPPRLLDTRGDD